MSNRKIILILVVVNLLLGILYLTVNDTTYQGYIIKIFGSQGIGILGIVGAFTRWLMVRNEDESFKDYFLNTNFLINAKFGVVLIGIPAFIIWVFFIR
jgi:hypothetical protein